MQFKEDVKIRQEKFGSVIFDTLREKVFITNESGMDILHLLKEGRSVEEIIDTLANSYKTQSADIKDDVVGFIAQLKESGIIDS